MEQSESIAKLAVALVKAQGEFPKVGRDNTAKVTSNTGASFSYTFASLPDVQAAVLPILHANGLAVVQGTESEDDTGFVVTTTLLHTSGEWLSRRVRVPVAAGKTGPTAQAAGSAFAYGRRIGLVGVVGVVTDDVDDDGAEASDAKIEHTRVLPPRPATRPEHSTFPASEKVLPSGCTKCGGPIYDNREGKKNPKAPDWKCKDKSCVDEKGFTTGGWCEKPKDAPKGAGPGMDRDIPLPEGPDDGDFDIF